jgi:hypothetical protein
VVLEFGDGAEAAGGDDALEGAEVGVVAAVLEGGEEFGGFVGGFDEGRGFG